MKAHRAEFSIVAPMSGAASLPKRILRVAEANPADVYEDGLAVVIPKWQKWARAAKRKLEQTALERKVA